MVGRIYAITFAGVVVSAVQDLFGVLATANMAFAVHSIELGQVGMQPGSLAPAFLPIKLKRWLPNLTAGAGGTVAAPEPYNYGDAAATITARVNDTTQMGSNVAAIALLARYWEVYNGFLWTPQPEQRPVIRPGQGLALSLDAAPPNDIYGNVTMAGTMVVEELF